MLFVTHYDDTLQGADTVEGTPDPNKKTEPEGKLVTQAQIDTIVEKRVAKMKQQNRQLLTKLEELESSSSITAEDREALKIEVLELRERTMSADEITKRESVKAQKVYEAQLVTAQETAQTWQSRYENQRISYEISSAASANKVLPQSLGLVESFLRPNTKLTEDRDDDGKATGTFSSVVDFGDVDSEGKTITVQMTIPEVLKRMSELPEQYGNLFEGQKIGGTGGTSGSGGSGSTQDPSKMSTEEYLKLRKENPEAALGIA